MKIGFSSQGICHSSFGVYRYTSDLVLELISLGQDVEISALVAPSKGWSQLPDSLFPYAPLRYPPRFDGAAKRLNSLFDQIVFGISKPSVLHATYYSNFKPAKNIPFIVTVYDFIHERFPHYFSKNDRAKRFKRQQMERADAIICISENTCADLALYHPKFVEKAKVIPLGLSKSLGAHRAFANQSERDPCTLLFVGSRAPYKNFQPLVEAMSQLRGLYPDLRLIAVGGGGLSQRERAYLNRFGFDSSNFQHLVASDENLTHLYRRSSALVFPSCYEGFGYPPLEAMAFGCPVVVANKSSMPEVVGDAGHFFDPDTAGSLREAIRQLLANSVTRNEKIRLGILQSEKFTVRQNALETLKMYKHLATT